MAEKRPAETSTKEPVSKKQAITTQMYEELKAKIAQLEKRNIDAQEMTQKQINILKNNLESIHNMTFVIFLVDVFILNNTLDSLNNYIIL